MYGPPGTGKTLLARACAAQVLPFLSLDGCLIAIQELRIKNFRIFFLEAMACWRCLARAH